MARSKLTVVVTTAVIAVLILSGLFLFRWRSPEQSPPELRQGTTTALDLGIAYLPLTPQLSAYYDLGVDGGALVTEVTSKGAADRAGIRVGDVILTFNGSRLEEGVPLLGMMRACSAGNRIVLEVWRGRSARTVELLHVEK